MSSLGTHVILLVLPWVGSVIHILECQWLLKFHWWNISRMQVLYLYRIIWNNVYFKCIVESRAYIRLHIQINWDLKCIQTLWIRLKSSCACRGISYNWVKIHCTSISIICALYHKKKICGCSCVASIKVLALNYLGPVKRICVFEHSGMTNFNCSPEPSLLA